MLIHTRHAMPMPRCVVALRSRFQNALVVPWHGRGMACVNQTRPHCVNEMGKTQSKPLAARHGSRTAWERHGMCELALKLTNAAVRRRSQKVWNCSCFPTRLLRPESSVSRSNDRQCVQGY
jgi:hypothetical protein